LRHPVYKLEKTKKNSIHVFHWVIPEKIHTPPPHTHPPPQKEISAIPRRMFLTEEANVISNFLHGERLMDVFWNDPLLNNIPHHLIFLKLSWLPCRQLSIVLV
jgi:hypothetical protein